MEKSRIKIWGRKDSSNVQKVLWCCDELDLAFDRVDVGGAFGGNKGASYLRLNPNGLVPTVEDDGFVLWESNSIVRYLIEKYGEGRLTPPTPEGRADANRWDGLATDDIRPSHGTSFLGSHPDSGRKKRPGFYRAGVEEIHESLGNFE